MLQLLQTRFSRNATQVPFSMRPRVGYIQLRWIFEAILKFLCGTGRKQDFAVQPDHGFVRRPEWIWKAPFEAQKETTAYQEQKKKEE